MSRNVFNDPSSTTILSERLVNIVELPIVSESMPVFNINNTVTSVPISTDGKTLLNTNIPALRTLILNGTEEAVVYEADNANQILFYTNLGGGAPTADKLRLTIEDTQIHSEVPILVGGGLQIDNGVTGKISTIHGNKSLELESHGTGLVIMKQGATECMRLSPSALTTPEINIKYHDASNNKIISRGDKNLYILTSGNKDIRFSTGGDDNSLGNLSMNIGSTKISVYKTIGVSGSGIDIGSAIAPFTNVYGTNVYGLTKIVSDKLRSTDLSPTDAIYQEIAFGLAPPAGGGPGVNEMNFLFDKTDEVSPPIGSSNAGTSVLRLTPSEADLNVPVNGLTINDGLPLKTSLIRHFAPASTTQTTIKMGTNKIQFYTGGLVATKTDGQEAMSIEDGAVGNGKINFKRDCEFSNDITLTTSINMATELKAFNSIHTANTKTLSVASYGTDASLGLTATGTGVIQANSDMSFSNGKKLTCRADTGDKIVLQGSTKIYTSAGQIHYYTPDLQTLIWAKGIPMLQLKDTGSSLSSKFVVGTNNSSFGKMAVKTAGGAVFNSLGAWDDNYMVVGEVDTALGQGTAVGIGTNTTGNYGVIMANSPSNAWRPLHLTASSIEFNHNGTNRMYIRGNIVVATNILPSASGVYNIGNDSNPGGGSGSATAQWFNNSFFNNVYAGNVLITSDRTMKEDIVDLPIGLDYIRKLRPKQYKYKGSKGRRHWGLIAQEVRELNGDDMISSWGLRPCGLEQLNYFEFIAPLIKAVQELDMKVEQVSHRAGGEVDTIKRNINMSVMSVDQFEKVEQLKEFETNNRIRIETLIERVNNVENILADKPPPVSIIDDARLDIIEERIKQIELKHNELKHTTEEDENESDGNLSIIDLIQQRLHDLEKRNTKLDLKVKKQTTLINKLMKMAE